MIGGTLHKWETMLLFVGDVLVFYLSLWLTLLIRHVELPSRLLWDAHVAPFSILFFAWFIVFFIAGLYEKHTTLLKGRLPNIIFNAQLTNSALAILFFYLIPYFGITPKTILFIYLLVSFLLVFVWRRNVVSFFDAREQEPAILVGSDEEMHELMQEINENPRYGLYFVSSIDLNEMDDLDFRTEIVDRVYAENITTVVVDTKNEKIVPILPKLYNLIFSHVRFIDMHKVYEDVFDRVPLSLVRYSWFLENISATRRFTYEFIKRVMDIIIALPFFLLSLVVYPLVALVIKLDDNGPVFIFQERVGQNNKRVSITKFRTMTGSDVDEQVLASNHTVTRAGKMLRTTRLDELPQLWDVLQGDLSLIGPRPELPQLVDLYKEAIPFYNIRHLIKPGLSGWAQLYHDGHPHHGVGVAETRRKLSYDLYYIKNRSLLLDVKVALKTLKKLLSRAGK